MLENVRDVELAEIKEKKGTFATYFVQMYICFFLRLTMSFFFDTENFKFCVVWKDGDKFERAW